MRRAGACEQRELPALLRSHPPRVPGAGGAQLLPVAPGGDRRGGGPGRHTVQGTPYRHGRVPLHRNPDRATEREIHLPPGDFPAKGQRAVREGQDRGGELG